MNFVNYTHKYLGSYVMHFMKLTSLVVHHTLCVVVDLAALVGDKDLEPSTLVSMLIRCTDIDAVCLSA